MRDDGNKKRDQYNISASFKDFKTIYQERKIKEGKQKIDSDTNGKKTPRDG